MSINAELGSQAELLSLEPPSLHPSVSVVVELSSSSDIESSSSSDITLSFSEMSLAHFFLGRLPTLGHLVPEI